MSAIDEKQLEKYYNVAMSLVMKCGPLLREGYQKMEPNFKVKSAFFDLVTVYDKQIEDLLIAGLKEEFPESKFIGEEESAESKREAVLTDEPTWIIDPIDGTTNFIHKIPHCCISVGLTINKELVVGIVFNPVSNEMYSAWKGHGAYLNGERIHVSNCTNIKSAVIAYEISVVHCEIVRDKNVKRLCKLASNSTGTRCFGSIALTLCYVASGALDTYHVEDMKAWDVAGGALILVEAGGVIQNSKGGKLNIMKPDLIAAATPELAKEIKNGVIGFEMSLIQLPHACDKNVKRISKLASNSSSSRGFGSAALSLCYLARGSIDCFHVEDLKSWDIAGGAIIVLEAGGVIHHTSGAEFKVMKPDCVVAATSELAKEVIQLILEADQITEFTFK